MELIHSAMGFLFLLLYLITSYLSPEDLFPELAPYRIVLWLAILTAFATIPLLLREKSLWQAPQSYLLPALLAAMMLSLVAHRWFGGTVFVLQTFLPMMIVFFFIGIHVNTWQRRMVLVFVLAAMAFLLMGHGLWDLHVGNLDSPYLMKMNYDAGQSRFLVLRIRANGYLADPNDLAQYLIVVLPLITLAWQKGRSVRNLLIVILPSTLLVYGIYLTHSRGAMLALVFLLILSMRKHMPTPVAVGLAVVAYPVMMVLGFSGGRDVSADAGMDRIRLWGTGLHLFLQSPIWGIGYNKFADFADLTAHNSYVLCLAETGILGYTCWLATLIITLMGLNAVIRRHSQPRSAAAAVSTSSAAMQNRGWRRTYLEMQADSTVASKSVQVPIDHDRPRRWAYALRLSFCGFLVTAWFLSRTYTMTLYVLLGLAISVLRQGEGNSDFKTSWRKWLPITAVLEVATVIVIYAMIRLGSFLA